MRERLLIGIALLLCSCESKVAPPRFTLRVAMVGPLEEFNSDRKSGYTVLAQEWVYEQLTRVNEDGSLAPGLASRFERRGRDIFLELRRGATFSDGTPVREADVIGSLKRQSLAAHAEGQGLVVESPASGAPLDAVLPLVLISRRVDGQDLGSGPFRVTSQAPDRIVLERVKPEARRIQRIELLGFPTPREALARTLAGDADLLPRVEPRLAEFFDHVNRLRLVRGRNTQAVSVAFSLHLSTAERRALAFLLSKTEVGKMAFGDGCSVWPWEGPVSTLRRGRKLGVIGPQIDVGYERLALAVGRALGERGGQVEILSVKEALDRVARGQFDLLASPALVWPPSVADLKFHSNAIAAGNFWGYTDRAVDQAIEAGDWTAALKALAQNPPLVFICMQERLVAVDARIKHPKLGPLAPLEFVPDWEVSQ